jgi:hypothetical protein
MILICDSDIILNRKECQPKVLGMRHILFTGAIAIVITGIHFFIVFHKTAPTIYSFMIRR